jgi:hypothetical protein
MEDIESGIAYETATDRGQQGDNEAIWSRYGSAPLPDLPKTAAVSRAFKAGVEFGLPEAFASALANAAVDPAALRVALNNPGKLNVAGGVIEVIDIDVFTPGIVPLPTNNRTMDNRIYPAGGATGYQGPLGGPRSAHGDTCGLWIDAKSAEHALEEARRAYYYILAKNPLQESVAARGIVMPVTVVFFEMRHRDGQPPMPLLGTADGSSRTVGAYAALGLSDPRTTHYDLPANRDSYRRFLNEIISAGPTSMNARAAARLRGQRNALIAPARVFLRFTPQGHGGYDYARAVAAYVGMLHVDPPRPWTPTGKLEAMAESVLEVLRTADVLNTKQHDYLAGLLTPGEAADAELPTQRDEQAAYVLATLLRRELRRLVDRGVMEVTAAQSVSAGRRSDVIAELALRPTRSAAVALPPESKEAARATGMRAAYLRATRLPIYALCPWEVTCRTPREILEAALAELDQPDAMNRNNPDIWQNRLELAALGQYHMSAFDALKREAMGSRSTSDHRGPQDILGLMLEDQLGLRILAQSIIDGRAGRPPRLVDEDGMIVHGAFRANGEFHVDPKAPEAQLTDQWLRSEGFPAGAPSPQAASFRSETPTMMASRLQQAILRNVEDTSGLLEQLDRIEAVDGGMLMDQNGWPASETKNAVAMLVDAQAKFGYWGQIVARRAARTNQAPTFGDLDEETSEESFDWEQE